MRVRQAPQVYDTLDISFRTEEAQSIGQEATEDDRGTREGKVETSGETSSEKERLEPPTNNASRYPI